MIALEAVSARGPLARTALTLSWGAGVHALVGTPVDGGPAVLALLSGARRPKTGKLTVLGGAPSDAAVRPRVARVPLAAVLPDGLRVAELLDLAAAVRAEPPRPAATRLAALGLEPLAARVVRSLTADEVRAVALAEALTSARVEVLLLEEPLVGVDPRAAALLPALVRARADAGCCVVVATASVRDAGELADDHVLLRRGEVLGAAGSLASLAGFDPSGARLQVLASDPVALAAALAGDPDVDAVTRRDGAVIARGRDPTALARAVARAVAATGVALVEMRLQPPTLEVAQAAVAGVASATFDAARARTLAAYAARPPEPAPR